jgi:hypothetical protein
MGETGNEDEAEARMELMEEFILAGILTYASCVWLLGVVWFLVVLGRDMIDTRVGMNTIMEVGWWRWGISLSS